MKDKKCTAIVLAGGQGKRMGTKVQKQYLEISGKPVLCYSLEVFEHVACIDDIILVVSAGQEEYCKKEVVQKYNISKVRRIVSGGKERYDSVWNGLQELKEEGYVFIHDGARPFINEEILNRSYENVKKYKACVVGMPSKDTIKIVDDTKFSKETPNRDNLWIIQTPQIFEINIIKTAYEKLMERGEIGVTDDAMVVEEMLGEKVKLVEGSYRNIKITTPEDLEIAEVFARKSKK